MKNQNSRFQNYLFFIRVAAMCILITSFLGCEQEDVATKRARIKTAPETEQANTPAAQAPAQNNTNVQTPASPVSTAKTTPTPKSSAPTGSYDNCVVTGNNSTPLRVRSTPGGNVIGSLKVGADIQAYDLVQDRNGENWTKIKFQGGTGFVSTQFISCG